MFVTMFEHQELSSVSVYNVIINSRIYRLITATLITFIVNVNCIIFAYGDRRNSKQNEIVHTFIHSLTVWTLARVDRFERREEELSLDVKLHN